LKDNIFEFVYFYSWRDTRLHLDALFLC